MSTLTAKMEHKTFAEPDETRTFERGCVDLVDIAGTQIGRLTLQPGWRWSEHVRPIAGTELCEAPHFQYQVQGHLRVQLADGTEFDGHPGDVTALPEGHDAWVVGDEPVVLVDWWGASNYAKG
jgi:quercetin dioxygenase-like cupin family protein